MFMFHMHMHVHVMFTHLLSLVKMAADLQGVSLIEKDKNGDILWTWSFPTIEDSLRDVIMRKCTLGEAGADFMYNHFKSTWYYLLNVLLDDPNDVVAFTVIVQAKDFNPEKYKELLCILGKEYSDSMFPPKILQMYMSVISKGWCLKEPGGERFSVTAKIYDKRRAFIASPLKAIINKFGIESILIYVALLLKKRIAVYSSQLDSLLQVIRALPLFVWHRQNWDILYPHVDLVEVELESLELRSGIVIGSIDPSIEGHTELYDLFINVSAGTVNAAPHAKDTFVLGKVHKEIALFMVKTAEDNNSNDQSIIKDLSVKTRELIANLKALVQEKAESSDGATSRLTLDMLRSRKVTPAMENFLYGLASAEGLSEL